VQKLPFEFPHIYIIDPSQRVPVKNSESTYVKKFDGYVFEIQNPADEITKIIDKFMDDPEAVN